jgi:hypothetical protein
MGREGAQFLSPTKARCSRRREHCAAMLPLSCKSSATVTAIKQKGEAKTVHTGFKPMCHMRYTSASPATSNTSHRARMAAAPNVPAGSEHRQSRGGCAASEWPQAPTALFAQLPPTARVWRGKGSVGWAYRRGETRCQQTLMLRVQRTEPLTSICACRCSRHPRET